MSTVGVVNRGNRVSAVKDGRSVSAVNDRRSVGSADGRSQVGCSGVGNANGRDYVLNHRADGSISVAFNGAVGKIAAETIALNDGAVQARGAHQSGGRSDEASLSGGENGEKNSYDLR